MANEPINLLNNDNYKVSLLSMWDNEAKDQVPFGYLQDSYNPYPAPTVVFNIEYKN